MVLYLFAWRIRPEIFEHDSLDGPGLTFRSIQGYVVLVIHIVDIGCKLYVARVINFEIWMLVRAKAAPDSFILVKVKHPSCMFC